MVDAMAKTGEIVIGNKGADHVALRVARRSSDGWSAAEIEVHCDGWFGIVKGGFLEGELASFAREVKLLHRELCGTARLQPAEPNIALTLTGDGKGHITVDGIA
jgi:hypothetical protein